MMKSGRRNPIKKNKGVSEVIGTMFIFAIFITLLTSTITWYIPAVQTSAEQTYQSDTSSALSNLVTTLGNTHLKNGSTINLNTPMGIKGGFFIPPSQSSISYTPSGFNGTLSYQFGVSYKYVNGHPTSGVLNKIVGTYPLKTVKGGSAEALDTSTSPNFLFVAGNRSNNVVKINAENGSIVGYSYAGKLPDALAYDPQNNILFAADYFAPPGGTSTISLIDASNMKFIKSYNIGVPNPTNLVYRKGALFVSSSQNGIVEKYSILGDSLALTHTFKSASYHFTGMTIKIKNGHAYLILLDNNSNPDAVDSYTVLRASNLHEMGVFSLEGTITHFLGSSYPITVTGGVLSSIAFNGNKAYISIYNATVWIEFYNVYFPYGPVDTISSLTFEKDNSLIINNRFVYDNIQPVGVSYCKEQNIVGSIFRTTDSNDYVVSYSVNPTNGKIVELQNSVAISKDASHILLYTPNEQRQYFLVTTNLTNDVYKLIVTGNGAVVSDIYAENYLNRPVSSLYDVTNGLLYVTNKLSGTISIFSTSPNIHLVRNIILGHSTEPTAMCVSNRTGYVYVAEFGNSSVAVVSNETLLKTISVHYSGKKVFITGMAFNSNDTRVYIVGYYSTGTQNYAVYFSINNDLEISNGYILNNNVESVFQSVSYDPYEKSVYAALYESGSGNYYIVNLSAAGTPTYPIKTPSTDSGSYSLAFDQYNGELFAAYSIPSKYGYLQIFRDMKPSTLSSNALSTIETGGEPLGPVFDPANNLVYVPNSAPVNPNGPTSGDFTGSGGNVTIINAVSGRYLTTIWVGSEPMNASFDPMNGYIYIPDSGSNKISIIDGGYTIYNGKVGIFFKGDYSFHGAIEASASTRFITPRTYYFEDGFLALNESATGVNKLLSTVPFSLSGGNTDLNLNVISIGLITNHPGNFTVVSSSPSVLQLQIVKKVNTSLYIGSTFYVTDLYGNQYLASVTDIYLIHFNLVLHTPYASLINKYLYTLYGNGSPGITPTSWNFLAKNGPFSVYSNENTIAIKQYGSSLASLQSITLLYYLLNINRL